MKNIEVRRVEKPWGYELIFADTPRYAGKLLHVRHGEKLSLQYHRHKEETLYLLSGRLRLLLGETGAPGEPGALEEKIVEPGACFHVPPETLHRFIALTDCVLIEVSTPELDDVVRLEDDYGRTPKEDSA